MSNKVTTIWKGGMQFESDNPSGKTVMMDTNVKGSDERFGLSPKAMMLSSLAGCSGIDIVSILEKMKVTDYELKMEMIGELTDEHPKYYHTVTANYHFTGKSMNESKFKKAVNLSVEKYCGVMEMFRRFATIHINIYFHKV